MSVFTLHRHGGFLLQQKGKNHCGIKKPHCAIDVLYEVWIVCDKRSIDSRGFIVDQINIHNYFKQIGSSSLSCERLAVHAVFDIYHMIQQENQEGCEFLKKIAVKIAPGPLKIPSQHSDWFVRERILSGGASVSYSWDRERDGAMPTKRKTLTRKKK